LFILHYKHYDFKISSWVYYTIKQDKNDIGYRGSSYDSEQNLFLILSFVPSLIAFRED